MRKKNFFLVILLMVAGLQSFSQATVTMNGKVINSRNEPVPGATVTIEGTNRKTAANVEGRFSFILEAGKKFTIRVSSGGAHIST